MATVNCCQMSLAVRLALVASASRTYAARNPAADTGLGFALPCTGPSEARRHIESCATMVCDVSVGRRQPSAGPSAMPAPGSRTRTSPLAMTLSTASSCWL